MDLAVLILGCLGCKNLSPRLVLPERAVFRVLYGGAHGDPRALDDDLLRLREDQSFPRLET